MPDARAARALVEFIDDILREHESGTVGMTRVVPCIIGTLQEGLDAVNSVIRAAGGTVLNATSTSPNSRLPADLVDFHLPVPGRTPSAMASCLEAALRYNRAGTTVSVRIAGTPDGVDASFVAAEPARFPLPPASDPLLALVRALCSERLAAQRDGLVVVIYDEADLDAEQTEAVGRVVTTLNGLGLGPRTLVLLAASGDVWAARHIRHEGGFRFALQTGEVLHRHPPAARDAAIANILGGSAPFIGLFLGAGFSASSRLRLGNSLRDRALARLSLSPPGASSEQLAADWYRWVAEMNNLLDAERLRSPAERVSSLTLERVLREEYRAFAPNIPETLEEFRNECTSALSTIGRAPYALAELLRTGRRAVICTVNFDQLVEATAEHLCEPFVSEADFERAPQYIREYLDGRQSAAPLLKLHGSVEDLRTCVASDDQTLLGLSLLKQRALEETIQQAEVRGAAPWVYVGASMRDTDLNPFWGRTDFAAQMREYWVAPFADASMRDFAHAYRTERWQQQRAIGFDERVITETADSFFDALAQAAQRL